MNDKQSKSSQYKAAGVDIDLAHDLLSKVKEKMRSATRPEMLAPIGGFGGMFQLDLSAYDKPVMVSSIDGVGTKLMVARMARQYDGIGHDIVNHCIDDIIVQGAEPLYFMDYMGTGRLQSPSYEQIVGGIADACSQQNVALLGGETAEMPGMYGDDIDVVGCITGIAEKEQIYDGSKIAPGDVMVGLQSSGLHTNGYSLARKILFEQCGYDVNECPGNLNESIADLLLKPHVSYWPALKNARTRDIQINGIAHITGGGWYDNLQRVLPKGVGVECRADALQVPAIMELLRDKGGIDAEEMYRVFNMGMGMAWFLPREHADAALDACHSADINAAVAGEVVESEGSEVRVRGL